MTQYEPRISILEEDVCECGHYIFDHDLVFALPGFFIHGSCKDCTCPKYHYDHTVIQKKVGGEFGRLLETTTRKDVGFMTNHRVGYT